MGYWNDQNDGSWNRELKINENDSMVNIKIVISEQSSEQKRKCDYSIEYFGGSLSMSLSLSFSFVIQLTDG